MFVDASLATSTTNQTSLKDSLDLSFHEMMKDGFCFISMLFGHEVAYQVLCCHDFLPPVTKLETDRVNGTVGYLRIGSNAADSIERPDLKLSHDSRQDSQTFDRRILASNTNS